jgi:hypothetical protein
MAMPPPHTSGRRLWRARRRHDRIDAALLRTGSGWDLQFHRNDRLLVSRRFAHEADARRDAAARLRDLERAGWVSHW